MTNHLEWFHKQWFKQDIQLTINLFYFIDNVGYEYEGSKYLKPFLSTRHQYGLSMKHYTY